MAVIGFLAHSERREAVAMASDTAGWLRRLGHEAVLLDDGPLPPLDLAVSLGGDGTMLRAVDQVSPTGVPVLGVNLGHLGYLTTVEPQHLQDALLRFLDEDYVVEPRMTLDVTVASLSGDGEPVSWHALNDVVIERPRGGHTLRAELAVNGTPFLTFAADSVIVCTPTGSTAYNLSARGPIVSPRARVQVVTPVAAHMLFDRSLVLDASEEVALSPLEQRAADLVVDGAPVGQLVPGQRLTCRQGAKDALLVTFADRDFHWILKQKFDLSGR